MLVINKQNVTFASKSIAKDIHDWQVLPEDSFSDHKKIYFAIKKDKHPVIRRRNVKHTNWDTYEDQLNAKVGLWFGTVSTPADIERELTKINWALITSFETACPLRKCSGRTKVPWWNHELKVLRQKANKAFHTAYKSRSSYNWEQHCVARWAFEKPLR